MWKTGCRRMGWVMVLMGVMGCQGGGSFTDRLASWWRSPQDPEYRLLLQSIDEYARKNGLTREQAIRQLREQADQYALQQRQQGPFYAQQPGDGTPQRPFSSQQPVTSTQQGTLGKPPGAGTQQGYAQQTATPSQQGGFYSQQAPTAHQPGGFYIPQTSASTQQGPLNAQQPSARTQQGQPAGSRVNQASWAQASDQEGRTPPMGLKPSSSVLR